MENENPPNEDSVNQIPLADTQYARTARDLNDIVNRLRQCGADADLGLSLPMIAVIGNQSVGKSSLIEAISEIQVPRSMDTCTRCPTEVRLQTAVKQDQWTCRVRVQLEDGGQYELFNETKNRKDVESILRRAQLAILNPNSDDVLLRFSSMSNQECAKYEYVLGNARPIAEMDDKEAPLTVDTWDLYVSETSFSKNSIVVEITGADVDVTFIDLPGLIRNGDPELIQDVNDLVNAYIEKDECIILVAIQMTNDMANQEAVTIAKKFDPEGRRTIGALTKADLIAPGEHPEWLKILRNGNASQYPLYHGYYVTRQPTTMERHESKPMSWKGGREAEQRFFWEHPVWSLEAADRLGTKNLTNALSELLARHIRKSLPTLKNALDRQRVTIQGGLNQLPRSLGDDPQRELLELFGDFLSKIDNSLTGTLDLEFFRRLKGHFGVLKDKLKTTKPEFEVALRGAAATSTHGDDPNNRNNFGKHTGPIPIERVQAMVENFATIKAFPGRIPPEVDYHFVRLSLSQWANICLQSFDAVESDLRALVARLCNQFFGRFLGSNLPLDVNNAAMSIIDGVAKETRGMITQHCDMEWRRPYTQNVDSFKRSKENNLNDLRKRHGRYSYRSHTPLSPPKRPSTDPQFAPTEAFTFRASVHGNIGEAPHAPTRPPTTETFKANISDHDLLDALTARGFELPNGLKDLMTRRRGSHDDALDVMAAVLTYFDIAYSQMIDFIPMVILHKFLLAFGVEMRNTLLKELDLAGENCSKKCKEYAVDDPQIESTRKDLEAKMTKLMEATNILDQSLDSSG